MLYLEVRVEEVVVVPVLLQTYKDPYPSQHHIHSRIDVRSGK